MSADSDSQSLFATRAARVTLVMSCLFGTTGVILVFLPRWLEVERGLSGAEIGAVLSLAQIARVVTGPLVAAWTDSVADRSMPLRIVAVAALAAYAAFFMAHGFWPLLLLGFIALSMTQSLTPLIEAAILRATQSGRINYGVARGIGSVAFIAANILGGFIVARFGVGAVVVWVLSGLATVIVSSWFALPNDPPLKAPSVGEARGNSIAVLLGNRRYLTLILACGLIQSAHAFYYGFSTLVWRAQGMSAELVGVLWAFGVAVEVAFLWSLPAIEKRVSPEAMIIVGAVGATGRWLCMGFAPLGFVLWPLQALHALSFAAAHVGAMRLLFRETPEHAHAMGQTLYAVLTGGVLMGACTLLSGLLYDLGGAQGYWAMAATSAIGGLLALLLLNPAPRAPSATLR
ncbi:MAG: MFS transporter [Hyphomonadaceae bacterium]|nr:MFS transporter [Hyphomonadaceae bacterium]